MMAPKRGAQRPTRVVLSAPKPELAREPSHAENSEWLWSLKLAGKSIEDIHTAYCDRIGKQIKLKTMKERLNLIGQRVEEQKKKQTRSKRREPMDSQGDTEEEEEPDQDDEDDEFEAESTIGDGESDQQKHGYEAPERDSGLDRLAVVNSSSVRTIKSYSPHPASTYRTDYSIGEGTRRTAPHRQSISPSDESEPDSSMDPGKLPNPDQHDTVHLLANVRPEKAKPGALDPIQFVRTFGDPAKARSLRSSSKPFAEPTELSGTEHKGADQPLLSNRKRTLRPDDSGISQHSGEYEERPRKRRSTGFAAQSRAPSGSRAAISSQKAASPPKSVWQTLSREVDHLEDAGDHSELSPLSTLRDTSPVKETQPEKGTPLTSAAAPETYETFVHHKLPAINQTLDLPQHEIADEYNKTTQLLEQKISKLFDHLRDDDFMEAHSQRIARHLKLSLPDVADLVTGARGPASFDRLQSGLKPSASFMRVHRYPGDNLVKMIFWGIVTTRIYHQDLLTILNFPGAHERIEETEGHFRNFLAGQSEDLAARHRFMYRDFRGRCLQLPQYQEKIEAYALSIFRTFEDAITVLFKDERATLASTDCTTFSDAIHRAVTLKCRVELSHYKCEWRWAPMNSIFEDDWMGPEAKRDNPWSIGRHVNRVCFGYSPAIIVREPDDGNLNGREEWETKMTHIKGNRRPRQEGETPNNMKEKAKEEDDGFNGWRKVILKAEVWTFDGPLSRAGPEWASR